MGKYTDKDDDLHNKGQSDYADDKNYDPPHGIVSSSSSQKNAEEQNAYTSGWEHARSQDHDGSCFLTAACVEHVGLPDDCHELMVLRKFRDSYVANLPNGAIVLREYYAVAPKIVNGIRKSPRRSQELSDILATVRQAVSSIEGGQFQEAFACYEKMFIRLKARYLG